MNLISLSASAPDPWIVPALEALGAANTTSKTTPYIIAALSNTFRYPESDARHLPSVYDAKLIALFDVFVSSAHEGVRKPDQAAYALALERINRVAKSKVEAGDVLFLDDIGTNLKEAKRFGFRTLLVPMNRTFESVRELERLTGLDLGHGSPSLDHVSTRNVKL